MNADLDTPSTSTQQRRAWLLSSLGIVLTTVVSAVYAGFVNLRGLTMLDLGLMNFGLASPLFIMLAVMNFKNWRTSEQGITRLAFGTFFSILWIVSFQVGLVAGIGILELERPQVFFGTVMVCLFAGTVLAYVWRAWLRHPFRWALLCGSGLLFGQIIALWVWRSLCGDSCDETRVWAGLLAGMAAGLFWALMAVPGLAVAVAKPSARAREIVATLTMRAAMRRPMPRWLNLVNWGVAVVLVGFLVLWQGLQTCSWLDRALEHSGCVLVVPDYDAIRELALSPDGTVLVHDDLTSDGTMTLQMRHVADGSVFAVLAFDDLPLQIRFSPDGRFLAAAGAGGLVRVWGTEDGVERYTLPVTSTRIAFAPDSATLLTTESRWRASDGAPLGPLPAEDAGIEGVAGAGSGGLWAWSPDRSLFAEVEDGPAEDDDWIVIRDAGSASRGRRLESPGGGSLSDLTFSPDGQMLAVTSRRWGRGRDNPRILVWRLRDGALLRSIPLEENADALTWGANSRLLLVWESYGRGVMGFRFTSE